MVHTGYRIRILWVLSIALVLVWAERGLADQFGIGLERHARVAADATNLDQSFETAEDFVLSGWLEDLLTRPPRMEVSETRPEPKSEEEVASEPENNPQKGEDSDPWFPRPSNIPPLYTSPALDGEGVWTSEDLPPGRDGRPLVYKTVYRPSPDFPNSVVYMAVFDMKRIKPRLFIGQTEPGIYEISYMPEREDLSKIVAITNAMWMQQHAGARGPSSEATWCIPWYREWPLWSFIGTIQWT